MSRLLAPSDIESLDELIRRYDVPALCNPSEIWSRRSSIQTIDSTGSSNLSRWSAGSRESWRTSITSVSDGDYQSVPTLVKTPWELERTKSRRRRSRSSRDSFRFFDTLPEEIYNCIVQQLEVLQVNSRYDGCGSCYLHDLCSLSLTTRAWARSAMGRLYRQVQISAPKSSLSSARARQKMLLRLKLLGRTLRECEALGGLVEEIAIPGPDQTGLKPTENETRELEDVVAAVIMACPNLERLTRSFRVHGATYSRLTQALTTRRYLKEHTWILEPTRTCTSGMAGDAEREIVVHDAYADPIEMFLQSHINWTQLDTLTLFAHNSGSLNYRAFVGTFRALPSLRRLAIIGFGAEDFNDRTLRAVPTLESLRLEDLHGVTDRGLLWLAESDVAKGIKNLALLRLEVLFEPILVKFFKNLTKLERFTLVQNASPGLMPGAVLPQPVFSSRSLHYLHWDVSLPGNASEDLANSIEAGAFPRLRKIRSPSDHEGMLQELCRPIAQIAKASDRSFVNIPNVVEYCEAKGSRGLRVARQAAQSRMEEARQHPAFRIIVSENDIVQHSYTIKACVGTLHSRINYSLESDIEGNDEAVMSVPDLMALSAARSAESICFCCGNRRHGVSGHGQVLCMPDVLGLLF